MKVHFNDEPMQIHFPAWSVGARAHLHRSVRLAAVLPVRLVIAYIAVAMIVSSPVVAAPPRQLAAAIQAWHPNHPPQAFSYGLVDLNDDGVIDAIVLVRDRWYCGSGGCALLILQGKPDGSFVLVSSSTISREPIYILPKENHSWHDFTVRVCGGGAKPCNAVMRFDGRRYPLNPSMMPCATPGQLRSGKLLTLLR